MDFSFTESMTEVSALARKFFSEKLTPKVHKDIDASAEHFSPEFWAEIGASGLLGTSIPEAWGGSEYGILELCALMTEVGAAVAPAPIWATTVLGALPIAELGTDEQRARLLDGVASGNHILTAALTETGSDDPAILETIARADGDGFLLTGVKNCVPAGMQARHIVLAARNDAGEIGLFVIDATGSGVSRERQTTTNREIVARLTLSAARAEALVVPSARGREALEWLVQRALVTLCAMELGVAERALRMTADYTGKRQQFDRPIATFQAVTQRTGDAYVDVESIRLTTWQAAFQLSAGRDAREAVAVAKYWACEAGHRVVYAAQHLHGGIGFDLDYPLHRYYVASKQIELSLGGASTQLAKIGAQLASR